MIAKLSACISGYSVTLRSVDDAANSAKTWLGKDCRSIRNKAGNNIFILKHGLRKIRFDIKIRMEISPIFI
ncbi:hypothetical protein E0494_10660 [Marinilabiliaceae bacterium JC040]|nr:hypothetical protein [Marinilabiliaceae bacterium JC040]